MRGKALGMSADTSARIICYCRDCQAFARYLGTPDILDAHGGSEVIQLTQSQLRIETGLDKLACVRLSETGLARFYASCCRTPIGNTMARARSPFFGVIQPFLQPPAGGSLDQALGPVRLYLQTKSASSPVPPHPDAPSAFLGFAHVAAVIFKGMFRGAHKPSVLFTPDGKLSVTPEILGPERHQALRAGTA